MSIRRLFDLAFNQRPAAELYDLRADPWQMNNVAATVPVVGNAGRTSMERPLLAVFATASISPSIAPPVQPSVSGHRRFQ